MVRLVMRVYLAEGYMIRWRRGDVVAYVFADREACDSDRTLGAIATIPVSKTGWTDAAEVKAVATRWLHERGRAMAGALGRPVAFDGIRSDLA